MGNRGKEQRGSVDHVEEWMVRMWNGGDRYPWFGLLCETAQTHPRTPIRNSLVLYTKAVQVEERCKWKSSASKQLKMWRKCVVEQPRNSCTGSLYGRRDMIIVMVEWSQRGRSVKKRWCSTTWRVILRYRLSNIAKRPTINAMTLSWAVWYRNGGSNCKTGGTSSNLWMNAKQVGPIRSSNIPFDGVSKTLLDDQFSGCCWDQSLCFRISFACFQHFETGRG